MIDDFLEMVATYTAKQKKVFHLKIFETVTGLSAVVLVLNLSAKSFAR